MEGEGVSPPLPCGEQVRGSRKRGSALGHFWLPFCLRACTWLVNRPLLKRGGPQGGRRRWNRSLNLAVCSVIPRGSTRGFVCLGGVRIEFSLFHVLRCPPPLTLSRAALPQGPTSVRKPHSCAARESLHHARSLRGQRAAAGVGARECSIYKWIESHPNSACLQPWVQKGLPAPPPHPHPHRLRRQASLRSPAPGRSAGWKLESEDLLPGYTIICFKLYK